MKVSKREIKGIIFDLDGTLADSIEDIGDAMNRVLKLAGYPQHSYDKYKYLVGKGLKNLVVSSLPENQRSDETIEHCHKQMLEDYGNNYLVKTKPYDGIEELLKKLYTREIKMAVLSNKNDEMTKQVVKELFDTELFEVVMGSIPDIPRKPDPAAALMIAKKLNTGSENIAFFGDTNNDMHTAVNAGMLPIGVLWGFRSREELLESGAEVLLEHPLDFLITKDAIDKE